MARPVDPESSSLVLTVSPDDGIKDELARVVREFPDATSRDIAVEVLLFCRGKFKSIHERHLLELGREEIRRRRANGERR